MAYKIIWSKTAEKDFDKIVNYIFSEWGNNIAAGFTVKANEIFNLLQYYPEAGSVELEEKNIRGFLVSKQVRLLYRIKGKKIIFLNFFDTRSNPSKKLKRFN
ncbi:MAG TPA: type II toxin-antitoxin system RelE/ParE family toxin [Ignavibacteria bacterium]|nr:hypothetical protein [Bacteroidota bacterium]HRE11443.1 type II toxin-antitoxin system RelE/ParE family toxin [Ignavibacteria bacterium]HRF65629.1 type II toxin-antitoxin system RelE/ParE family toxin [Ignavibacteria bacterium]